MAIKNPNIAPSGKRKAGRPPGAKNKPKPVAPAVKPVPPATAPVVKPAEPVKANENNNPAVDHSGSVKSDTELFGGIKLPDSNKSPANSGESFFPDDGNILGNPGEAAANVPENGGHTESVESDLTGQGNAEPAAEKAPPKPSPEDAEAQRPLVSICIDAVLNALAAFMGAFWLPRPVGNNAAAGECPYDERERLVVSGCKWFASMAIALLTPGQEFAMECFNYTLPRSQACFAWIKSKMTKKKPAEPKKEPTPADTRMPGGEKAADVQIKHEP